MGKSQSCMKVPKLEINSNCCRNENSNSIHYCNTCGSRVNLADLKNADYDIEPFKVKKDFEQKYDKVSSKSSYPRAQGKK